MAVLETREDQVYGYECMAAALPAGEIQREAPSSVAPSFKCARPADGGKGFRPSTRLNQLARVVRGWLDLGDIQQAPADR